MNTTITTVTTTDTNDTTDTASQRYVEPGFVTRRIMNPLVAFATRRGVGLAGSRLLTVRGRTSGLLRQTVVNVLELDGERYLVAPRGTTEWVRNLRVAGEASLRVGRRTEPVAAVELEDGVKVPVLREYLRRWGWEVGAFFEGISAASTDEELTRIAPDFPVFRLAAPGAPQD
jgi:deazaflavin-dependent oxidoreductase (nitroreductase family)